MTSKSIVLSEGCDIQETANLAVAYIVFIPEEAGGNDGEAAAKQKLWFLLETEELPEWPSGWLSGLSYQLLILSQVLTSPGVVGWSRLWIPLSTHGV